MKSSGIKEASLQEKLGKFVEFQLSCLKFLKNEAVKVLHSVCHQIWKTQQCPQYWKRSVFIPIQKKCNSKECSNYHAIVLISLASKVMFKILQGKFKQYLNQYFPDAPAGFRKGRGTRDQIANICWIIKKARELKKITCASLTM